MKIIKQVILSGVLSALATVMGVFANFPLFGGHVYLIGVIIFVMPLILRLDFAIISTTISVVLTDILTGWGGYSWISFVAYTSAVIILWLFIKFKFYFLYVSGLIFSSGVLLTIYFFLEQEMFGTSMAIKDLIATSIQMVIVVPLCSILFIPIKLAKRIIL